MFNDEIQAQYSVSVDEKRHMVVRFQTTDEDAPVKVPLPRLATSFVATSFVKNVQLNYL